MPRLGGLRQQQAAEHSDSDSMSGDDICIASDCPLTRKLLLDWAWDDRSRSSLDAQKTASVAVASGACTRSIQVLASCGTDGAHEHNCKRDIENRFFNKSKSLSHLMHVLPAGSTARVCIQPHELFSFIHKYFPHVFTNSFGADPVQLVAFWKHLRSSELGRELFEVHPHLRRARTPSQMAHSADSPWISSVGRIRGEPLRGGCGGAFVAVKSQV